MDVNAFSSAAGTYKLASEKEPGGRAFSSSNAGTHFSWTPAAPDAAAIAEEKQIDSGFLLYNSGDTLVLYDQRGSANEQPELLQLRDRATCHDLHWRVEASPSPELEVLIGFASGELLLWRPLNRRREGGRSPLAALTKESAELGGVCGVAWRPHLDACFAVAHAGGKVALYDRRKLDESPPSSRETSKRSVRVTTLRREPSIPAAPRHAATATLQISGSGAAVNALAFSWDGTRLAAATADGVLGIVDMNSETVVLRLRSYYGGLLCCCWSRDDNYLLSGGEDDLLTIWCPRRRIAVARGLGHRSWVNAVAFDPIGQPAAATTSSTSKSAASASSSATYRFASVGADTRLLLWEFSEADLALAAAGDHHQTKASPVPKNGHNAEVVPAQPYKSIPLLQPQSSAALHAHPITGLHFGRSVLLTSCVLGVVKVWARPTRSQKL